MLCHSMLEGVEARMPGGQMKSGLLATHGLLLALLQLLALGCRANAAEAPPSATFETQPDGTFRQPWKVGANAGQPSIEATSIGDQPGARLTCNRSSFSLNLDLDRAPATGRALSWTWKAVRLPDEGDVRRPDRNDQAAQVLVRFEKQRTLSYIWDTTAPVGRGPAESYLGGAIRVEIFVLRSGPADIGKIIREKRDLAADYEAAFGEPMGRVTGLRVQTNCQNTGSPAEAIFGPLLFDA